LRITESVATRATSHVNDWFMQRRLNHRRYDRDGKANRFPVRLVTILRNNELSTLRVGQRWK